MLMTPLHWLSILFFIVIFGLIIYLTIERTKEDISSYLPIIVSTFLLLALLNVLVIFGLEEVTKKAKVSNIKETRIYQDESMIVSGTVANIGRFPIGSCTLEIAFKQSSINTDLSVLKAEIDATLYQKSFLERIADIFKPKIAMEKSYSIVIEEPITQRLEPGEQQEFVLRMRYPSVFDKPKITYKTVCH